MARHAIFATCAVLATAGDSVSMVQQAIRAAPLKAPNKAQAFRAGELVEALDPKTGSWMPSYTVGAGSKAQTFSLAVPAVGVVTDVASVALRRATRMRSGDLVEVHDLKTDEWYPGTILGDGGKENTYDVDVPISGKLPDVPAVAIRRAARLAVGEQVEVMDTKTGLWVPSIIEGDGQKPGTYNLNAHEVGELKDVVPVIVRRSSPPRAGDAVEVLNNQTKNWEAATVVSNGTKPDTYLLVVQDVGYVYDVPALAIRKAALHPDTAIGSKLYKYEIIEFMDSVTGMWFPALTMDNGTKADTYNIEAAVLGKMFDVSIAAIRRAPKFQEGDIAEVIDIKTGQWIPGTIVGEGRVEYTMDITIPELGFYPDVPLLELRKGVMPQTGEVLEVIDTKNKQWLACRILGPGTKPNTFNLSIPSVGRMSDVPMRALRRVARPKVKGAN